MLLPLLSGIFGASSLLLSISSNAEIPAQKVNEIKPTICALAEAIFSGDLGESIVA